MFCDARSWRHVIRNYAEKVQLECLHVEHANIKSNAVYKKRELQLNEFTREKLRCRTILNLKEKMK